MWTSDWGHNSAEYEGSGGAESRQSMLQLLLCMALEFGFTNPEGFCSGVQRLKLPTTHAVCICCCSHTTAAIARPPHPKHAAHHPGARISQRPGAVQAPSSEGPLKASCRACGERLIWFIIGVASHPPFCSPPHPGMALLLLQALALPAVPAGRSYSGTEHPTPRAACSRPFKLPVPQASTSNQPSCSQAAGAAASTASSSSTIRTPRASADPAYVPTKPRSFLAPNKPSISNSSRPAAPAGRAAVNQQPDAQGAKASAGAAQAAAARDSCLPSSSTTPTAAAITPTLPVKRAGAGLLLPPKRRKRLSATTAGAAGAASGTSAQAELAEAPAAAREPAGGLSSSCSTAGDAVDAPASVQHAPAGGEAAGEAAPGSERLQEAATAPAGSELKQQQATCSTASPSTTPSSSAQEAGGLQQQAARGSAQPAAKGGSQAAVPVAAGTGAAHAEASMTAAEPLPAWIEAAAGGTPAGAPLSPAAAAAAAPAAADSAAAYSTETQRASQGGAAATASILTALGPITEPSPAASLACSTQQQGAAAAEPPAAATAAPLPAQAPVATAAGGTLGTTAPAASTSQAAKVMQEPTQQVQQPGYPASSDPLAGEAGGVSSPCSDPQPPAAAPAAGRGRTPSFKPHPAAAACKAGEAAAAAGSTDQPVLTPGPASYPGTAAGAAGWEAGGSQEPVLEVGARMLIVLAGRRMCCGCKGLQ